MSGLLHFAEHRLQEAALIFMALVYTKRVLWLLKFPAGKERQGPTGAPGTPKRKGVFFSWAVIGLSRVIGGSGADSPAKANQTVRRRSEK